MHRLIVNKTIGNRETGGFGSSLKGAAAMQLQAKDAMGGSCPNIIRVVKHPEFYIKYLEF